MKRWLVGLLLVVGMVGCGTGTESAKTPAKAVEHQAREVPEQPAKSGAESDGNQAQPQKAVTPRFSHSTWYKLWGGDQCAIIQNQETGHRHEC